MNDKSSSHTALLWIVATGFFMQALDTTIVNTALPEMARQLNVSPLEMQPVVVAYTLTMALLTPASGWLADRFGTRSVYFTAILIFVLGSLSCASAHSLDQLVIARVMQGIGGSMLISNSVTFHFNGPANAAIAINDGTGAYSGVHGSFTDVDLPHSQNAILTIRVS